jgi:hypothetical protein
MADQADFGWVDENGLRWCAAGGAAGVRPAWFTTLVSVMAAGDLVAALGRAGFTTQISRIGGVLAQHPSGLRLVGDSSLLTAALCYWDGWDLQFAPSPAWHARQQAAFEHAYQAVRAVGVVVLGEPTLQGRDRNEDQHRWSVWRIGEVVLAVHQAVGDVQFGLSIQTDVRRYPTDAPLQPRSPFVDWLWSTP